MVNVAVLIILFACDDITHLLKTCSVINSQFKVVVFLLFVRSTAVSDYFVIYHPWNIHVA